MFDWIDNIVHLLDVRHFWRIYLSVAAGFFFVLTLSKLPLAKQPSVFVVVCCLVIPGILGALWHCAATRD